MGIPLRVLLVEDGADDALPAVRELRGAGYAVTEARVESPAELAAALAGPSWDILLADDSTPRFTAAEAIRTIGDAGLDLPVIVLSGTMSEDAAVGALRTGARDFIFRGNLGRLVPAVQRELREAENRWARRTAERSLERATGIQDLVLRKLPLVLYSRTPSGIAWISENAESVLGFPPLAFLGGAGLWDRRIHPDDREVVLLPQGDPVEGEPEVSSREYRWQRADGSWRWFLDHSVAVVPQPGGGMERLGILWDVSERKHLEEEFLQAQKMEALGRLAAGVSHDFNNMLMVIQGYGELLVEALPEGGQPARYVREILGAAVRSSTLTRQLLAFSRRQVLQPRILDLNDVVTGARSLIEKLVTGGVSLELRLGGGIAAVRADPGSLDQALMNLAVNARDAMEGTGTLGIETANVPEGDPLLPRGARPGNWVMLAVSDTGCGIPPDVLERIFDPFFTTKGEGRGTGLGLATVKGIVERCSGLISVESVPGSGTTLRIFLPGCAEGAAIPRAANGTGAEGGTETVLVVDDERAVLDVTAGILVDLGYRVLTACTGEEALSLLDGHRGTIDLVITDVMMPGMDGHALVRELADHRPSPGILYISGYPVAADEGARSVAPEAAFLAKPFRRDALARKVREALRGRGRQGRTAPGPEDAGRAQHAPGSLF